MKKVKPCTAQVRAGLMLTEKLGRDICENGIRKRRIKAGD
jgi:hypothetical protein